jgi:hemolysin activation/secretion protein
LPYLFSSPVGLKTELQIFKQDSSFQNTRTSINLGYFFNYNTRLYLGYDSKESSDIQNTNSSSLSDFKNKFYTSTFEYIDLNREDLLFPEKTKTNFKIGTGNRDSKFQKNKQLFASIRSEHNITLNSRNSINLRAEGFYLKSDEYLINELYRFGGINSIRGFNENSLQANTLTSIQTEYRYKLSSNLYAHSIIDYGYYNDATLASESTLLGFGFGFGLLTKNGLLNLIYANGKQKNQEFNSGNSIVHISLKANF